MMIGTEMSEMLLQIGLFHRDYYFLFAIWWQGKQELDIRRQKQFSILKSKSKHVEFYVTAD